MLWSGPHPQLLNQVQILSPQSPATQSSEVQTAFIESWSGKMRGLAAGWSWPAYMVAPLGTRSETCDGDRCGVEEQVGLGMALSSLKPE